jgi:hypothetical protein
VTSGFGQRVIYAAERERVSPGETVLSWLQSQCRVETGPGDRSVRSIDGIEADDRLGRWSWSYFVNGLEGTRAQPTAACRLAPPCSGTTDAETPPRACPPSSARIPSRC